MKRLNDNQYEHLRSIALPQGITLNGYTANGNTITLQNNRRIITGTNMQELIDELNKIKY